MGVHCNIQYLMHDFFKLTKKMKTRYIVMTWERHWVIISTILIIMCMHVISESTTAMDMYMNNVAGHCDLYYVFHVIKADRCSFNEKRQLITYCMYVRVS